MRHAFLLSVLWCSDFHGLFPQILFAAALLRRAGQGHEIFNTVTLDMMHVMLHSKPLLLGSSFAWWLDSVLSLVARVRRERRVVFYVVLFY